MIPRTPLAPPAERIANYRAAALHARKLGHKWRADALRDQEQAERCFRRARDLLAVAKRIRDQE